MTTPSPTQAVADAARAVEEAWDADPHRHGIPLGSAMRNWLAARRAARDAGYVEAMVSREAVEALRECVAIGRTDRGDMWIVSQLLRDLDGVIKGP